MAAGFFPQQIASATGGACAVSCPTVGAGLGASISAMSFSAWSCNPYLLFYGSDHAGVPFTIQLLCQTGIPFGSGNALPSVQLQAQNGGGPVIMSTQTWHCADVSVGVPCYDHTDAAGNHYKSADEVNFLVSIDFVGRRSQVWVNDQALVMVSGGWGTTGGAADNSGQRWELQMPVGGSAGDVWAAPTFIDFSDVTNRRKFINADLSAVALPSSGQVTVGGVAINPTVYLRATAGGAPASFYGNNGVGPDWALSSGSAALVFPTLSDPAATNPCMTVVHGTAPPPILSLDNLLVTAAAAIAAPCLISLEWSNDKGRHFQNPVSQSFGRAGEYRKTLTWQRLGYARNRVFRLTWSCPSATALLGAWIEVSAEGKGQG